LAGITTPISALSARVAAALAYREEFRIATTAKGGQHAVAGN
jgi:hypothetical protein